jgi:hypothetical protein
MQTQLQDAIRALRLKPGEAVVVEVDGHSVEIRELIPEAYLSQPMMMPWFDSPASPIRRMNVRVEKALRPDPPIIPEGDSGDA